MLLKLIGAVCVITCCGFVGFRLAACQKREERYLETLIQVLQYMMLDLQHKRSNMTDLFYKAAEMSTGSLKKIFHSIYTELSHHMLPDISSCVNLVLKQHSTIPENISKELYSLGRNLNNFNISGQIKGVSSVIDSCEYKLKMIRSNKEQRLRTYQTLGLCAGAAIVIIFI